MLVFAKSNWEQVNRSKIIR